MEKELFLSTIGDDRCPVLELVLACLGIVKVVSAVSEATEYVTFIVVPSSEALSFVGLNFVLPLVEDSGLNVPAPDPVKLQVNLSMSGGVPLALRGKFPSQSILPKVEEITTSTTVKFVVVGLMIGVNVPHLSHLPGESVEKTTELLLRDDDAWDAVNVAVVPVPLAGFAPQSFASHFTVGGVIPIKMQIDCM